MEENLFGERTPLRDFVETLEKLKSEIGKVIVGQGQMIELLIAGILADGHILIEGVPGVAKTLTAKLLSRSIDVGFSRIQFTPDLMPGDVIGASIFNPREMLFQFRPGPIFSNIILIDEINRAPAKTQAALFEVMEERQITVDGQTMQMQQPFLVIATQNPIEQEGTYHLPEAQLDRFLFKIKVDYPSESDEVIVVTKHHNNTGTGMNNLVQPVLNATAIDKLRKLVNGIHVEEKLVRFIVSVVASTRQHKSIYLGASPRASIGILQSSKAIAAINGRDFVVPEDILYVIPPVLRHRLVLSPEKEMEGGTTDDVIKQIIQSSEIPR
ncbi:MAG TPA: MoxR family ATPase [Puia sp.]|jgi:MoxR-like ATPase|nr:MoxR family ATPase [Puia sp.]